MNKLHLIFRERKEACSFTKRKKTSLYKSRFTLDKLVKYLFNIGVKSLELKHHDSNFSVKGNIIVNKEL